MRTERIEVDGVPANLVEPPGAEAVLLLGHGGGHSKDSPRFERLARRYADRTGLAVVCIDSIDHGERRPVDAGGAIPAGWHSQNSAQMVDDWRATAEALEVIGPATAYVGFSMGAIFGFPTVAAMTSIQAAVFVVGGIPSGGGIDDPHLRPLILDAASSVHRPRVLMLNKTEDEIFPVEGVRSTFDAIPATTKELRFWDGDHNDWPSEMIDYSITFLRQHLVAR